MNLPEFIGKILDREEHEPIDEVRVSIVEGQLQVTHQLEVTDHIADAISKNFRATQKELKELLPCCVNFGMLPCKNSKNVRCSTLTLQVNMSHNTVDEINELAEACEHAHRIIIQVVSADIRIENIYKDIAHLVEEQAVPANEQS